MVYKIDRFILKNLRPSFEGDGRIQKYKNYIYVKKMAYQLCWQFPKPVVYIILQFFISIDFEQLFVYLYIMSKLNAPQSKCTLPEHNESPLIWNGVNGVTVPNMSISNIGYIPNIYQIYKKNYLSKMIVKLPMLTCVAIQKCLSGYIPKEIFKLKHLHELDLSNNALTGTIPSEIGLCKSLTTLDLSNNLIEGTIPIEIEQCASLRYLDFHGNKLIKIKLSKQFINQLKCGIESQYEKSI